MLRLARVDAPGVLHYVIISGIERIKIFVTVQLAICKCCYLEDLFNRKGELG